MTVRSPDEHLSEPVDGRRVPDPGTDPGPDAAPGVVGRTRELALVRAALRAGCDILLEGPPGTSKSTMLRTIARRWGAGFHLVEGNADLTPARLVGHHDPARVLAEGYTTGNFVAGPLVEAMRSGGFLYIEELNRTPEDTLNVLLAAMSERAVAVPRYGTVVAEPAFRLLASMNPFDDVGTSRIADSVYDRWCRLAVGYQPADEEHAVVVRRTGVDDDELVTPAVAIVRATREHADLVRGSSVRGAIDTVAIAAELRAAEPDRDVPGVLLDAAMLALSARIEVDVAVGATPEEVITAIWEAHFFGRPGGQRRASPS